MHFLWCFVERNMLRQVHEEEKCDSFGMAICGAGQFQFCAFTWRGKCFVTRKQFMIATLVRYQMELCRLKRDKLLSEGNRCGNSCRWGANLVEITARVNSTLETWNKIRGNELICNVKMSALIFIKEIAAPNARKKGKRREFNRETFKLITSWLMHEAVLNPLSLVSVLDEWQNSVNDDRNLNIMLLKSN